MTAQNKNAQQWPNYGNFDNGGFVVKVFRMDHTDNNPTSGYKFIGEAEGYYYYEVTPQVCSYADDCAGGECCLRST